MDFWIKGGAVNIIIIVSSFFLFLFILRLRNEKIFLSSLVNVFPSLGLLGTVVGMVQTFSLISGGNIDRISDGISVSLLTTLSGITISLIGIFLINFRK
jgi:biopolymer transport protein ExbB/TolQ